MISGIKMSPMEKLTVHSLYAAAIVFLAASCAPEQIAPEAPESPAGDSIPVEIKAEINQEEITKTQYTSDYKFGWTSGDQIRMPVVKKSGGTITACDFYTFTTSSESGSASATFAAARSSMSATGATTWPITSWPAAPRLE